MTTASRRFSLVQMIAVTTATAAAIAFYSVLNWPPLGRSGLVESCLPGAILLAALWFCGRSFSKRMTACALVGTGLAMLFLAKWMAASDLMFGHYHGPPPWIIVAAGCACLALAASVAWFIAWLAVWRLGLRQDDHLDTPAVTLGFTLRTVGMGGVVLLSGLIALVSVEEATRAWGRMDYYVEGRLLDQWLSIRQWAERLNRRDLPKRAEMASRMANQVAQPGDEAAIPELANLLGDDEPEVRRATAQTLEHLFESAHSQGSAMPVGLDGPTLGNVAAALTDPDLFVRRRVVAILRPIAFNNPSELSWMPETAVPGLVRALEQTDPEVQQVALAVLGAMGPKAAEAVKPLTEFMGKSDDNGRTMALATLARIQPESAGTVARLAATLTKPYDAHARSMAARELGAMGPAARAAIPAFIEAWEKRMLTIEDAQAMYAIDPEAAANAGIPRAGGRP